MFIVIPFVAQAGNRDVAFALFPALSMLNHSCRPNCVYANFGAR